MPTHWDLVVVGAGTAGLPAAIFGARRGLRVLAVEKSHQVGGTLYLSGGTGWMTPLKNTSAMSWPSPKARPTGDWSG